MKFEDEIVTVGAVGFEKGERKLTDFRTDELIRDDTTLEGLSWNITGTTSRRCNVAAFKMSHQ